VCICECVYVGKRDLGCWSWSNCGRGGGGGEERKEVT